MDREQRANRSVSARDTGSLAVGTALVVAALASVQAVEGAQPGVSTRPKSRDTVMEMLLEKTLFKVDILRLEVRLTGRDAERIAVFVTEGESQASQDSIAAVAIDAQHALIDTEFIRSLSLDQFVGGARDDLDAVQKAGIVSEETYQRLVEGLPNWFGFLSDTVWVDGEPAERRIQKGDSLQYRIDGDTIQTRYSSADGTTLMQRTDVDPETRRAILGTYFVQGSQFRKKLIRSLFKDE